MIQLRGLFLAVLAVFWVGQLNVLATDEFPTSPDPTLTPGSLCTTPNSYRYAERIAYCKRNVSKSLKLRTIHHYDETLGYKVGEMDRAGFKIDHYIPLCMGGSNQDDNLWPQHKSVYEITDPLEQALCEKMSQGKLLQREAVELIERAKNNLNEAQGLLEHTRGL